MTDVRILIVEDENIVAEEVRFRLKNLGYTIADVASSGEEAIEKAAATHPDLVLMDIMLKGNMDGIEAAEQIRSEFQDSTWQAFWQTNMEGKATKEVAESLGMTVGAVYIARSRVLARLKQQIQQAEG